MLKNNYGEFSCFTCLGVEGKYQLYYETNSGIKIEYLVIKPYMEKISNVLLNEFNAILEVEGKAGLIFSVWFNNKEDFEQAAEYLESLVLVNKILGAVNSYV